MYETNWPSLPSVLDPFLSVRTHSHLAAATPITFCICSIYYVHSRQKTLSTNSKYYYTLSEEFPKLDSTPCNVSVVKVVQLSGKELQPSHRCQQSRWVTKQDLHGPVQCGYSTICYENSFRFCVVVNLLLTKQIYLQFYFLIHGIEKSVVTATKKKHYVLRVLHFLNYISYYQQPHGT
jgi:hypothetical protein